MPKEASADSSSRRPRSAPLRTSAERSPTFRGGMADVARVESLTKRYGDLLAVDDVSFSVREGEVFGILGPNGAGKTTTLECIEGLVTPTAGAISVLGMDAARDADAVKRRIGVQLQASAYFDYLTLTEILDLFARIYDCAAASADLLRSVGLVDSAGATMEKLSGGQRQRFTIAAALVNDPDLVFLDEPTAGLDPQARRSLWDLVSAMAQDGRTVIMTTHYIEEAESLCDRVAIMDRGRIVALDTPRNLVRSMSDPHRITLALDGVCGADGLRALRSVTDVTAGDDGAFVLRSSDPTETVPALTRWLAESGFALTRLEIDTDTLEDAFLALTGRELRE